MSVFTARFNTYCICCEDRIYEGDQAKWADGEVIHADCDIYRDDRRPVSPACPKCFMVPASNGLCGCET